MKGSLSHTHNSQTLLLSAKMFCLHFYYWLRQILVIGCLVERRTIVQQS